MKKRIVIILISCCLVGLVSNAVIHGLVSPYGWIPSHGEQFSVAIKKIDRRCHSTDEPIKILIMFHNTSDDTIPIPDIFNISTNGLSYSIINAYIKSALRIDDPGDPCIFCHHRGHFPIPTCYYEVPADGVLEKEIEYYLPSMDFLEKAKDQPLKPGLYFLRISYALFRYDEKGRVIRGAIDIAFSNRIVICVK